MSALSLRSRTTLTAVVLAALVLGGGAWVLMSTLEHQLVVASDRSSRSAVADLVDQAGGGHLPSVLRLVDDDGVAQVFTSDGTVLAASANIVGQGPITAAADSTDVRRRTFDGPDDQDTETYRSWVMAGTVAGGEVTAVVGSSLEAVHETSTRLRTLLLVGVPLAVALLAAIVWLLVGRALGRLDRVRSAVDDIGPTQLDRSIDVRGPDDEVGRLAATMNRMLTRLDASAERQRRLVADVSHDLQSPLATQRASLELALRSRESIDPEQLRSGVLAPVEEMERLVADLLVLAAADEGLPTAAATLDLDVVVLEEAARAMTSASIAIRTKGVSAGPVRGDPGELRRVVRNLIDNAVAWAATEVELTVATANGLVVLDVVDDGPGIPAADREAVFERFHRGDRSRSRHVPGSGLGLAIARTLTERAGGRLDLVTDETAASGAHFRVVLPALPATS